MRMKICFVIEMAKQVMAVIHHLRCMLEITDTCVHPFRPMFLWRRPDKKKMSAAAAVQEN